MSRVFGRVFLAAIFLLATGQLIWAASGNKTMKLKDVAAGQVVQVGNVKFVKVAADKYLALNLCPQGSTYSSFYKGCVVETTTFDYTGDYQTFTAPETGPYVVELWGASGNIERQHEHSSPGLGGYVADYINFERANVFYVYVGQQGLGLTAQNKSLIYSYNGGGYGNDWNDNRGSGHGGGATDIRIINGDWSANDGLRSRIMVAAAGGGMGNWTTSVIDRYPQSKNGVVGGESGGLIGYSGYSENINVSIGGTQNEVGKGGGAAGPVNASLNGAFGKGGACNVDNCSGGGGGWYGGGAATHWSGHGSGGSSYISGHTGCVAVTSLTDTTSKAGCDTGTTDRNCSLSPTGYSFTHTVMIDGAGYSWTNTKDDLTPMPDPTSVGSYYDAGVGHTGNGAARITQLSVYLGI